MNIALVMPHWTTVFEGFSRVAHKTSTFPPLNLAMLGAVLEKAGHRVTIIDAEIELLSLEQTLALLQDFKPDLVGFTATTPIFHISSDWAKTVKEKLGVPVAIGGFHITLFGKEAFHDHFDVGFLGEADNALLHYLNHRNSPDELAKIPGIIFRRDGDIISTGTAVPASDLDSLPIPARHLLKTELYHIGTMKGMKYYTSIMASRGCPFKCVFCTNRIGGTKVRYRSVDNVLEEIRSVVESFGIRHFYFVDDVLTLNRQYMLELCDKLHAQNIEITFEGSTRANLVDDELMAAMKKAGLIRLSFGLETADEAIREIIKKEVPLECYAMANKIANRHGIETINSVMLGLPGDTRESIRKTVDYLRTTKELKHASFSIAMPYPGTELYEMAVKGEHGLKLLTEDFSQYQRYGSAVMEVNGMTPDELLRLQKIGLFKIYAVPWRWLPVIRRMGIAALIRPAFEAFVLFMSDVVRTFTDKATPMNRNTVSHPDSPKSHENTAEKQFR